MKDLRSYRAAFRLGRPYWSGPSNALQDFVHHDDAAGALLGRAAIGLQPGLAYATDGHPVAFRELMDHFARLVGNPLPLHLGGVAKLTAWVIIKQEHMEAVKLGVPAAPPSPMVPGWKPAYPDYREGLTQVLADWN
jgi:nucleoside-diphosphate-sugar epimerase